VFTGMEMLPAVVAFVTAARYCLPGGSVAERIVSTRRITIVVLTGGVAGGWLRAAGMPCRTKETSEANTSDPGIRFAACRNQEEQAISASYLEINLKKA